MREATKFFFVGPTVSASVVVHFVATIPTKTDSSSEREVVQVCLSGLLRMDILWQLLPVTMLVTAKGCPGGQWLTV